MICKMIKFFLGAVLVHYLALLADVQPPVIESMPLFEATTKWSAPDVWQMARTDTMATAVSLLTGAVHGTGAPEIQLDEMKGLIDVHTAADTRKTILKVTDSTRRKKDKKISNFTNTVNPAAVCATADTAGGRGLEVCAAECEHKRFRNVQTQQKAACYVLCTLAAEPCIDQPFSLGTTAVSVRTSAVHWVATAPEKLWTTTTKVDAMTSQTTKEFFLLFVFMASKFYFRAMSLKARKHAEEAEEKLEAERRAIDKLKVRHVSLARSRWLKQRALFALHDHFAHSAYRDSKEAKDKDASCRMLEGLATRWRKGVMAARLVQWQRAAKEVKAVAVQVAIDAVLREQGEIKGQGGAGCNIV